MPHQQEVEIETAPWTRRLDAAPVLAEPEFDAVVNAMLLAAAPPSTQTVSAPSSDLISEDEFDALLDKLQRAAPAQVSVASAASGSEIITDDEFEALLDKMHGAPKPAPVVAAEPGIAIVGSIPEPAPVAVARVPTAALPSATNTAAQESANTIRLATDVLDQLMKLVSELMLIRNRLKNLQATIGNPEMTQAVANLDALTGDLQMNAEVLRAKVVEKGLLDRLLGFLVDGPEEVVINPPGAMLQGIKGMSGATITGNGRIALVLDLPDLIDAYGRR